MSSWFQNLAFNGSCSGHQYLGSAALGVQEGKVDCGAGTEVRNILRIINACLKMLLNSVMNRLVAVTIQTGTATSTLAVVTLVMWVASAAESHHQAYRTAVGFC